jgi:hypothetical protein
VLVLSRRAGFTASTSRAFDVCDRALAREAGWRSLRAAPWFPMDIAVGRSGRPVRVRTPEGDYALEVVGRLTGLAARERGWRVRLENGAELMLIREPGEHWYADVPLAALFPTERPPPPA